VPRIHRNSSKLLPVAQSQCEDLEYSGELGLITNREQCRARRRKAGNSAKPGGREGRDAVI
jgi:hypothetical protein